MEHIDRNTEQQEARRQVDAFLRECEAYLRAAIEDEWIAAKGPDFSGYLWERLKEASAFGLEEKMLIMKYMTAAVLTDDSDPDERAEFVELKRDLESGEYEEAELLNAYIESYLDEGDDESGAAGQYPGQSAATDDILDELAVALRSSIRTPFRSARLEVERLPGFVDFQGYYHDSMGEEQIIEDLLVDDTAFDAVHRLYAIMIASGAEDWNRLEISSSPGSVTDVLFWYDRGDDLPA
jgi:hypothetical protein